MPLVGMLAARSDSRSEEYAVIAAFIQTCSS
jgi:hypothetical protein